MSWNPGLSSGPFTVPALLVVFLGVGWLSLAAQQQNQGLQGLDIYVIDVEGGEATLFVSPSGESMLVDTGWPGFDKRRLRHGSLSKTHQISQITKLESE